MKKIFLLISTFVFSNCIHAETELSSYNNKFPFKYQPTLGLELIVTKKNNAIQVIYPNGEIQEIVTIESLNWNNPENITKDLNFDGYIDLGIWVEVNPRGLNESYDLFVWDSKKLKLKEAGGITNPSIESNFLIDNGFAPYTMCPDNEALCVYKTRFTWKNNQLSVHSTLAPRINNQIEISFYKDEKIVRTITVPYEQVDVETKKWNTSSQFKN